MKKAFAFFACLSLSFGLLTGCANKENKTEKKVEIESAETVVNENLSDESVAIAVGQEKVVYREFKIYNYLMKFQYENILTDKLWNYSAANIEAKSVGQEAVEDVLRLMIQVKVIKKEAALENVALESAEKEEADLRASNFYNTLSDKVKKDNSINLATLSQIFEENKLAQKMYNRIIGQTNNVVTDEQCQCCSVQLLYLKKTEKNLEDVKLKINQLYQKITSGADKFFAVARENSQLSELEVIVGKSDSKQNLSKACLSLKEDAMTPIVEEEDGYYIAKCVKTDNKSLRKKYRNQVLANRQILDFQNAYKTWSDKFEVRVSKSLLA